MKNIYYLLWVIALLFAGCYEDLGNYDYHEINEIVIKGLPEEEVLKYRLSDTLQVEAIVEGNLDEGDMSRYYYTWKAVSKDASGGSQSTSYILGNEARLNYFVQLPDNRYEVYCYVKDTLTRVTWQATFDLKVTSVLNDGWLILSDLDGYARLDMISLAGKEAMLVHDLLPKEMPAQKGPRKLCYVYNMMTSANNGRMYLLSESGANKLNTSDYTWDEANSLEYEMAEYPANYAPDLITAGFGWEAIVGRNSLYVESNAGAGGPVLFSLPLNFTEVEKTDGSGNVVMEKEYFELAPMLGSLVGYSAYNPMKFVYDVTHKRFLTTDMKKCAYPKVKEDKFKFQTGLDYVTMGVGIKGFNQNSVYIILEKLPEHRRYLYTLNLSGSGAVQGDSLELKAAGIEQATAFAFHPSLTYLFYAVGGVVYEYDFSQPQVKAQPVITLENETISLLKFNIFRGLSAKPAFQNQLIVGSKMADSGLSGRVRMYEVPVVFGKPFDLKVPYYDGIGVPVDVTYREQ